MIRYLLGRLGYALFTLWFLATATFFAMHAVPGDPLSAEKAVNEDIRQNLRAKYGLDQPLVTQYRIYLGNMLQGDFGISYTQKNRSVNDIIREHFPVSAQLGVLALLFATAGGVLLGVIGAYRRNRWPDYLSLIVVIGFISVPGFVFAALAQMGMLWLNAWSGREWLPVAGWQSGSWRHMLLPSLVLGLGTLAFLARLMRSTMLDVMDADYMRTARAKGLSPSRILFKHQLRNAVLPVITVLGPAIAGITTGGFVVEQVFAIPGLGRYFVQAVQQLDYTVIMGTTVFYGAFLILLVMLVDMLYGLIDPRIRLAPERLRAGKANTGMTP